MRGSKDDLPLAEDYGEGFRSYQSEWGGMIVEISLFPAGIDATPLFDTTALTGPDPYETTASLLAWGAIHAATPDTDLRPGVHGPVAAFGLDTLTLGATESGLHEA